MPDQIPNLRQMADRMTAHEAHFLANAEFLKFRKFVMSLTPESLAGFQAAFTAESYPDAPAPIREMCQGTSRTTFLQETVANYDKVLAAVTATGTPERFGFPANTAT